MIKRIIFAILTICIAVGLSLFPIAARAVAAEKTILATTFPIYQITRNVAQGRDGVKIDLMLSSQMGCPHDYALTPQDMQKLAKADILVVNGLGMEEFLGAPVKKANPRITVIDSSMGIRETINYSGAHEHHHHAHGHAKALRHDEISDHGHAHHSDEKHHHHAGVNPHLFASPKMTAKLAMSIAKGLSKADPKGAAVYLKNARAYAGEMNKLAGDMAALGKRLKNNRIVQPHGVFDYLARLVIKAVIALQFFADKRAELFGAAGRGVLSKAAVNGFNGGFLNMVRRVKIRLSGRKTHDIHALGFKLIGPRRDRKRC